MDRIHNQYHSNSSTEYEESECKNWHSQTIEFSIGAEEDSTLICVVDATFAQPQLTTKTAEIRQESIGWQDMP